MAAMGGDGGEGGIGGGVGGEGGGMQGKAPGGTSHTYCSGVAQSCGCQPYTASVLLK
jgi:hypothetical protein